tara:strand:+ start:42859 stop:43290 length:432 start_codon:yes stop_codon:yes gene_type:complete
MTNEIQNSLKIAFASSNETHLDEHLGKCQNLSIYHVTPTQSLHIETISLNHYDGHNEQKISDRLTALSDCFAVYCLACGNPVRQQLLRQGTRVIIRPEPELINLVLPLIQANWPGDVVIRQQRQIHKQKSTDYLNHLADSEWD